MGRGSHLSSSPGVSVERRDSSLEFCIATSRATSCPKGGILIQEKVKVGIFGTGNIGTDLLVKLCKQPAIEVSFVIGRRIDSPGIKMAKELGISFNIEGLSGLEAALLENQVEWLADTSSAMLHTRVRKIVEDCSNARILDFTPSDLSTPFVPMVDTDVSTVRDLGLISCGAQSSIPLVSLIAEKFKLTRVELVSSLASLSVGPATRLNLDEYIEKTERALSSYSRCLNVKAILIVNPATPPINMSVALYLRSDDPRFQPTELNSLVQNRISELSGHIPNFRQLGPVVKIEEDLLIAYEVTGSGDHLPPFAGNLDVLTHAAAGIMLRAKS
jgi:acetaldehyde dehydrogenase (acetylating)